LGDGRFGRLRREVALVEGRNRFPSLGGSAAAPSLVLALAQNLRQHLLLLYGQLTGRLKGLFQSRHTILIDCLNIIEGFDNSKLKMKN
jgi:hypothetical protein